MPFNPAGAPIGSQYLFYGISNAGRSLEQGIERMKQRSRASKGATQYGTATGAFTNEEADGMSLEQKQQAIAVQTWKGVQEDRQRKYQADLVAQGLERQRVALLGAEGVRSERRLGAEQARDYVTAAEAAARISAGQSSTALAEEAQRMQADRDAVSKAYNETLAASARAASARADEAARAVAAQRSGEVLAQAEIGRVPEWQRLIGEATGTDVRTPVDFREAARVFAKHGATMSEPLMAAFLREDRKQNYRPESGTVELGGVKYPWVGTSVNSVQLVKPPTAAGEQVPTQQLPDGRTIFWNGARWVQVHEGSGATLNPEDYDVDNSGNVDLGESVPALQAKKLGFPVEISYRKGGTNAPARGGTNAFSLDDFEKWKKARGGK